MSEPGSQNPESAANTAELTRMIGLYNDLLWDVPPTRELSDKEKADIENNLYRLWEYDEALCAMSGWCRAYQPHLSPGATDYVELAEGRAYGFVVDRFGSETGGRWGIGIDFAEFTDGYAYERNLHINTRAPYGLVPAEEVDSAFPEGLDFPTVWSTLSRHSDLLVENVHDPEFYRLNAWEQRHYFDVVLREAGAECQIFEQKLTDSPVAVGADTAYVQSSSNRQAGYAPLAVTGLGIFGRTAGLTILGRQQLLLEQAIRTPSELVDEHSGLCLQVSLDKESARVINLYAKPPHQLVEGTFIALPISGQHIDVTFDETLITSLNQYDS